VQNVILKRKKLAIGQIAPDFKSKSDQGTDFNLSGSLGKKVTILDFWASWCGPCRMENPNLVKIYGKYHAAGLEIISYSLDKDENAWKTAIEKDQMTWKHASNLIGWEDGVAKTYQIQGVPTVFILDAQGAIIAKDLRGNELDAKIAELLMR
jgi:thiol-disulfide isomerase/thioredoxin